MSLAPVAYLLFQKVMRHNPTDTHWPGRDRFVLSCGHSSLTLYLQLYLGGFGLELDDIKALRTWDSKTPGHPEYGHTAGRGDHHRPARPGRRPTRSAWPWPPAGSGACSIPDAAPGESPFDHHIYCLASDGDIEEGVSSEASSLAGTQRLGNLTLIYDSNRISIEDDTNIALSRGHRRPVRGVRLARPDHRLDQRRHRVRRERRGPRRRARGGQGGHRPAQLHPAAHHHRLAGTQPAGHRQVARRRARRRRGGGDQEGARLRPGPDLRGQRRGHQPHPEAGSTAAQQAQDEWQQAFDGWAEANPERQGALRPDGHRRAVARLGRRSAQLGGRRQGHRDPRRIGQGAQRADAEDARAVGRLGRPGRVEQHHPGGRAELPARRTGRARVPRQPVRPRSCTSASASTPWARS